MTSFRSTTMISFGDVLYHLGEIDEAERLAIEGEELGAAEDVINFAWGRALRARIAADRGDCATAEDTRAQRARKRVQDRLPERPRERARGTRARTRRGRPTRRSAQAELQRAVDLWERYGYRAQAERARALLVEL